MKNSKTFPVIFCIFFVVTAMNSVGYATPPPSPKPPKEVSSEDKTSCILSPGAMEDYIKNDTSKR